MNIMDKTNSSKQSVGPTSATKRGVPKQDEHLSVNARFGLFLTSKVGSMWSVYITVIFVFGWIVLAIIGPLDNVDSYPFPFLFMGNLLQLLMVSVILVGQGVLGRTGDRRAERTFHDAESILSKVVALRSHLFEQDRILNNGIELSKAEVHPRIRVRAMIKPSTVKEQYVGLNGNIAAAITKAVSTMWAFYLAAIFQFG